jgi:hypothetical protein
MKSVSARHESESSGGAHRRHQQIMKRKQRQSAMASMMAAYKLASIRNGSQRIFSLASR